MGCCMSSSPVPKDYNEVLADKTLGLWCVNSVSNGLFATYMLSIVDTGEVDLYKETKVYKIIYKQIAQNIVFASNQAIKFTSNDAYGTAETVELKFVPFGKAQTMIHGYSTNSNQQRIALYGYRPHIANKGGFISATQSQPWTFESMKKLYRWQLSIEMNNKCLDNRFLVLYQLNEKSKDVYMCYWRGYYAMPSIYDGTNLGNTKVLHH